MHTLIFEELRLKPPFVNQRGLLITLERVAYRSAGTKSVAKTWRQPSARPDHVSKLVTIFRRVTNTQRQLSNSYRRNEVCYVPITSSETLHHQPLNLH